MISSLSKDLFLRKPDIDSIIFYERAFIGDDINALFSTYTLSAATNIFHDRRGKTLKFHKFQLN